MFEVVEEEETLPELDNTSEDYLNMNPVDFFASKGLKFDTQLNLFFCKKCDAHIINRARNGFTDENLSNHLKQSKHKGNKKVGVVDCRLALEKFKQSEDYVQFDARKVFNGMDAIKNLKIVQLPFKCQECETFSLGLSSLKRHYEKAHGSDFEFEQGMFECQKVIPGGGFIRVVVPLKESKRTSVGGNKRALQQNLVKPTVLKSKRFCARPVDGDENIELVLGEEDGEEVDDDLNEFLTAEV